MKNIIVILLGLFLVTNVFGQDKKEKSEPSDRLILDLYLDLWQDTPDNMETKWYSRGINLSYMYDMPIGTSNFSFAPGISISSHNLFSNSLFTTDTTLLGKPTGDTKVLTIKDMATIKGNEKYSYNNNKLNVTYIDIPLELRYINNRDKTKKNERFRVSLGLKVGLKISDHMKYKGDDFIDGYEEDIKFKQQKVKNIESYRYGVMARVGYGWVNLNFYYSLSKLFDDDNIDMYPISIGLSVIPL